jgi:large subunit ribosomal protein L14
MLTIESIAIVADNSGPKTAKCLKLLNNHGNAKVMYLGNEVIVAPQKKQVWFRKRKIEKKVFHAVIISVRAKTRRSSDNFIKFSKNWVLLMNEEFRFLGTRVRGPICREIRKNKMIELKYKRIISYSRATI